MVAASFRLGTFLRELRRRRVIRVAVLYVLVGVGVVEAADLLFPRLGLPDASVQLVLGLLIVGFPVAMVLAWAYELTPQGLRAEAASAPAAPAAPPVSAADRDRLLVLPFADISADHDNEYFSDGLTEEIIADLSRIRALGVISRTSAMRLKGADKDVLTIGRELGVRYVLEGSVRKSGERIRISAQLIDATIDQHLWSETYDGTVAEVFEIQERVAGSIAGALRVELSPAEQRELGRREIEDPVARESYLRARHELYGFSREGLEKAQRHIRNAIEIVGENELLLATLGQVHMWFVQSGVDTAPKRLAEADACVEAIFRLNPDSRHGHRLRGIVDFQRGDLRSARPHLQVSLDRDPDDPDALAMLGYVYCLAGSEEAGLALFDRLLAIDPLTPLNHGMPGFVAVMQGRFADAVEPYRTFLRMDDEGPFSAMCFVWVLGLSRRIDEAGAVVERAATRHADSPFTSIARSLFHGFRGEAGPALEAVTPAVREAARHTEMFSRFLAEIHALAGDAEGAIDWLEQAVAIGLANYPFLSRIDPTLTDVRGHPRFAALMDRVEAEWRAFRD